MLGWPTSIEQSTRSLAIAFITFLVTDFGTAVIAAYGIGTKILSFGIIPALGFATADATLVGQAMGAGKIERAEKISKVTAVVAFISLSLLGIAVFFLAKPICALFSPNNQAVLEMSVEFVRLIALSFGFIGLQQVFNGTFSGSGNTLTSMILAILGLWILRLPLVYFLSRHTSLSYSGILWAFPVSTLVAAIVSWLWFLRGSWKKKRITEEINLVEKITEEAIIEETIV
jgi:Na+-driven multidrug efflux pump